MGYVVKKAAQRFEEKKAAIYVRVSTQYQVDRASLPVQREELINYAKYALGISDYVIFEDAGYSAKNTDRPDYQQMMARMRTGEFSHLLVWKIDRISRNLLDFSVMYAELKELGVVFVSKNEQFDTSSAMGEAMLKIILIFAELERKTTSERVSAVFVSRANDGIWNGGKVPYGYSYDKESKTFSIAEDEAKIVRLIYSLYESEKSIVRVARIMNERGLKSRAGSDWSPTTVHTILSSPFYSGTYRYNYRDESNTKRFREKGKDEWVLVENHHPAIVSPNDRLLSVSFWKASATTRTPPISGKTSTSSPGCSPAVAAAPRWLQPPIKSGQTAGDRLCTSAPGDANPRTAPTSTSPM